MRRQSAAGMSEEVAIITILDTGGTHSDVRPGAPLLAPQRPSRRGWSPATALVIAAIVVGVVIRVWAISSTALISLNADEAETGIMVQRILAGRHQYIFYAGQQYNGSLEQYLQAAMYWVLRLPQNGFTLRLPQIAMMALATWLMYLVGCRLLQRQWAAVVAAALFAVGPYWTVRQGVGTFGAYPSLIVVGLVSIYCALRLHETGRRQLLWAAGFGLCVGLVAWLGLSGVELLVPAGLLAAPYFLRSWRLWPVALPAVVVGMSPLLVWSVRNGKFALFNAGPAVLPSTFGGRFHGLFGPVLREFIGVGYGSGAPGWPLTLQYLSVAALAIAYVVAVIRRRRSIAAMLTFQRENRSPFDALLIAIPIIALLYCTSKWAWYTAQPRYLFAFSPVLIWCLAAALPARPGRIRVTAVLAGLIVFGVTSATMLANRAYSPKADQTDDLTAAAHYLAVNGELDGYADYWTAMPFLYLSHGSLNVAPLAAGRARFPDITAQVDSAPTTFYLSSIPDSTARTGGRWMEKLMTAHHVSFDTVRIGKVVVYDHLSPDLKPWQLGMGSAPAKPAP